MSSTPKNTGIVESTVIVVDDEDDEEVVEVFTEVVAEVVVVVVIKKSHDTRNKDIIKKNSRIVTRLNVMKKCPL